MIHTVDKCINLHEQIISVCLAAYHHLTSIHYIEVSILNTRSSCSCSPPLFYISFMTSIAFQLIQNSATSIVTSTQKYNHITPILPKLHVKQRIHVEMLLTTYKSITDQALEYLCELLSIRKSSRKLGSSSQIPLQVYVSRLRSYGDCAFNVGASVWLNMLPEDIINAFIWHF